MTSLTIGIHPPHDPTVELLNRGLAVANFGEAMFFARTPAEAETLILAGVALKDLLLAASLAPCPDPAQHEPHDRCPGVARCPGEMGFVCYREAGHDGAHDSAPPTWNPAPLPPDVSGDLDAIPANRIGEPAPQCLTCGATEDLSAVHVRAREGIAARTEWYCHDTTTCHRRRHPEAASLVAQHGTAGAV